MKKNHINFAHPNKGSNSLASQWSRHLSQPKSRREGEPKIKLCKNRVWSRHHNSYYRKLWKTIKKSKVDEKQNFGSGSRVRVGKVLTPHKARPKTVPLIKCAKVMWFFQNIYFPQK